MPGPYLDTGNSVKLVFMTGKQPRYELPRAAPGPLREIQQFVNTIDLSHDREWLTGWLEAQGLESPGPSSLTRAREVREAIRDLLYANNGQGPAGDGLGALTTAANAAMLTIDFAETRLVPRAPGIDGILGRITVLCFAAMADGSWKRLKCCRNRDCRWAFYDGSKNVSATWCSMQICGNRSKTRAYRRRSSHEHRS